MVFCVTNPAITISSSLSGGIAGVTGAVETAPDGGITPCRLMRENPSVLMRRPHKLGFMVIAEHGQYVTHMTENASSSHRRQWRSRSAIWHALLKQTCHRWRPRANRGDPVAGPRTHGRGSDLNGHSCCQSGPTCGRVRGQGSAESFRWRSPH